MNDDMWINAGTAFLATSNPTLKPLADMIRSDQPIPKGIRDMLAQMIDPDSEGYLSFKLKLVSSDPTGAKSRADFDKLKIVSDFDTRYAQPGLTREVAAEETGEKYGVDPRTVFRHKNRIDRLKKWLRGER